MSRETDAWRARAPRRYAEGVAATRREVLTVLRSLRIRAGDELCSYEATRLEERDEDWREGYHSAQGSYGTVAELLCQWECRWGVEGSPEASAPDGSPGHGTAPPDAAVTSDVGTVGDGRPGPEEAAFLGWLDGVLYPERRNGGGA